MTLAELQKYQKHIKDFRCKHCIHFRRIQYTEFYTEFYCDTRKSFSTKNNKIKIKSNDVACALYFENTAK